MEIYMVKIKSKIKDCHLCIQVKLTSKEIINEREFEFFSCKNLRGFLKARNIKKFGFSGYEYTGPIGISLSDYLKKPISKYDFLFLIEQIVALVQTLQKNALSIHKVIWEIQNIYINETTREIQLIYLPLENQEQNVDLLKFIDTIIYSIKLMPGQNSEYISRFTYFMRSLKEFDCDKIEQYIQTEDRSIVNTIKRNSEGLGHSGFITDKQKEYYDHYRNAKSDSSSLDDEEPTGLLYDEDNATSLLFEDEEEATGLLIEDDGTTLLTEDYQVHYPTLFRVVTEETISINKPVFRIGKEKSYSDYFVANNNAVSRSHADIISRNNKYYVIDLNSKNRTYINNQIIPIQQETQIFDGDKLRLGNEEFIFYV